MSVTHIASKAELQNLIDSAASGNKVVLVDFFATWCPPCKRIAPMLELWAGEYEAGVLFGKIDVDAAPELSKEFSIEAMPTFVGLRKSGDSFEEFFRVRGADVRQLVDFFKKHTPEKETAVKKINSEADLNALKSAASASGKILMLDFFAVWCPPCIRIAPILEEWAVKHADKIVFGKVDVDACPSLTEQFSIQCMPTFVGLKADDEVYRCEGADVEDILKFITSQ